MKNKILLLVAVVGIGSGCVSTQELERQNQLAAIAEQKVEDQKFENWANSLKSLEDNALLKTYGNEIEYPRPFYHIHRLDALIDEINRRELLTKEEWVKVREKSFAVGDREGIVFAIFGDIERQTTESFQGVTLNIYRFWQSRLGYVYVSTEEGKVTWWKHTPRHN